MASTWHQSQLTGTWSDEAAAAVSAEAEDSAPDRDDCSDRSTWFLTCLARTIEGEIIPRLMLAHRAQPVRFDDSGKQGVNPGPEDIAELARLSIRHEADVVIAFMEAVAARGVSLESLLLELLAPAARHLGELWNDDLCDFTDVTVGLGRLQHALHVFTHGSRQDNAIRQTPRKALLAAVPGEQHTFGVSMVAEFFRQAQWDVCCETGVGAEILLATVRAEHFDLVGLSIGSENRLEAVKELIQQLRENSCNPDIRIMVGGQAILDDPSRGERIGADATALDGRRAVLQSQQLLGILPADFQIR